jgi:hypothetical protein
MQTKYTPHDMRLGRLGQTWILINKKKLLSKYFRMQYLGLEMCRMHVTKVLDDPILQWDMYIS